MRGVQDSQVQPQWQHSVAKSFCDLIWLCHNPHHFPTAAEAFVLCFWHVPPQPLWMLNPTSGPSLEKYLSLCIISESLVESAKPLVWHYRRICRANNNNTAKSQMNLFRTTTVPWVVTAVRAPHDNVPPSCLCWWPRAYLHLETRSQSWAKNGRARHEKAGAIWSCGCIFRLSILDYSSLV